MVNKYRSYKAWPPYQLFVSLGTFFQYFIDYLGAEGKYLMSEIRDWGGIRDVPDHSLFPLCLYS